MAHCLKAWVQIWIPELWREGSSSVQYLRFWFVPVSNFTLWCTWFPPECGTSMLPNLPLEAVLSSTFLDFREYESNLKMAAACFHALQYYSLSCKCCSGYHWSLAILQQIFFFLQNFCCIKITFQKSLWIKFLRIFSCYSAWLKEFVQEIYLDSIWMSICFC